MKPFHGARVCFLGFHDDEERHMTEVLEANGGTVTNLDDVTCSHVVSIINSEIRLILNGSGNNLMHAYVSFISL